MWSMESRAAGAKFRHMLEQRAGGATTAPSASGQQPASYVFSNGVRIAFRGLRQPLGAKVSVAVVLSRVDAR